jgi:hypothetical protein
VKSRRQVSLRTLDQSGMRVGELTALEWRDVDVAGNRFRIRGGKTLGEPERCAGNGPRGAARALEEEPEAGYEQPLTDRRRTLERRGGVAWGGLGHTARHVLPANRRLGVFQTNNTAGADLRRRRAFMLVRAQQAIRWKLLRVDQKHRKTDEKTRKLRDPHLTAATCGANVPGLLG